MIKIDELLYELEVSINKVSSEDNLDVPLEDKLLILNRAQIELVKSRLNPNNTLRAGYEENFKRIDDLQILKVPDYELSLVKSNSARYLASLGDVSTVPNYMFYVSSYALVKTKKCEDSVDVDLISEKELSIKYFSDNHKPSFEWRSTIGTMANDKIYVYTANAFTPKKLYLTYLRYPKKIDKEGLIHADGSQSLNQDCELPEYMKQDIIDLATKYYSHFSENQLQAQLTQNRLNTNE